MEESAAEEAEVADGEEGEADNEGMARFRVTLIFIGNARLYYNFITDL